MSNPPSVPRTISRHERWFIEDYEPQIDTVMPEWRRFGETAGLALHEIYQMSQSFKVNRIMANRFDHAREMSDTYYYEFFLPLGPLGPTPRLDRHRENLKRTIARNRAAEAAPQPQET